MARDEQSVAVVGLGRSGLAAVTFLAERGVAVLACDEQAQPTGVDRLRDVAGVALHLGPLPVERLTSCRSLLLSPGVPREHPAVAAAVRAGVTVCNDVEWLYKHVRAAGEKASFIGITGTNGKSTVTTLIGLMMQAAGVDVEVGGNLGQAALTLWRPGVASYVLELSSFQLESMEQFHPQVAVLLNVTPDHLDRYASEADYLAAKQRLFARQGAGDWAVLNADDPVVAEMAEGLRRSSVGVVPFSVQRALPGGLYATERMLVDHRGGQPRDLIALDRIKIAGLHNRSNAAAAAAASLLAGASPAAVVEVLSTFPGLTHRMEWIRTIDGVQFINDSKGTNVGAVVQSLGSFAGDVVLIAGGRDKHGDFAPMVPLVRDRTAGVVLIGEAAELMAPLFAGVTRVVRADSMAEAVRLAWQMAPRPGGTVLLSPACASFDMFRNFEDRGEKFREAVHEL